MESLVSIIIPTYNRAHLIGETLDSIIAQTYSNWECIVIDDGSKDNTKELLSSYTRKDKRIQYFQRPKDRSKGGNTCRNYGFELSKGDYVKWFDSDDIMLPEHVTVLVNALQKENVDFVVGDSVNFEEGKEINLKPYEFDKNNVVMNAFSFAKNKIGWITDDFLGKRGVVEGLRFNEELSLGQEYNFFIKMLQQSVNGFFVDEVLTQRRVHAESISLMNRENDLKFKGVIATLKIQTAKDLVVYDNKELIRWFLSGYMKIAFELAAEKETLPYEKIAIELIFRNFTVLKGISYVFALVLARSCKKGYTIMKYARS